MNEGKPDFANVDWNAVFKPPGLLRHLIPDDGKVADWIIELREQKLGLTPKELVPIKKKSTIRGRDCGIWIKKYNRNINAIGKRKRKPLARPPTYMMNRPATLAQYQRHSIHLMSCLLSIRMNASPFTLILDDLNQRAMPLVLELVRRGLSRNINVVMVSFEATRFHPAVRSIAAYGGQTGQQVLDEIRDAMNDAKESLVIVDSLNDLVATKNVDLGALFNLVVMKFASTLVGVYHQDMFPVQDAEKAYAPHPLNLVSYMATTIITCKSFAHVLAAKAAKERSLAEPTHGLLQGAEGIVQCLDADDHRGIVFEADFRRKSGRSEHETYFLRTAKQSDYNFPMPGMVIGTLKQEFVKLLDQVPAYGSGEMMGLLNAVGNKIESTFNLSLTDKQKQAREGVVLPYFDAQSGEGGEGGRILYEMGAEDDFDEEEDEI